VIDELDATLNDTLTFDFEALKDSDAPRPRRCGATPNDRGGRGCQSLARNGFQPCAAAFCEPL